MRYGDKVEIYTVIFFTIVIGRKFVKQVSIF